MDRIIEKVKEIPTERIIVKVSAPLFPAHSTRPSWLLLQDACLSLWALLSFGLWLTKSMAASQLFWPALTRSVPSWMKPGRKSRWR